VFGVTAVAHLVLRASEVLEVVFHRDWRARRRQGHRRVDNEDIERR
jgi:hypothetical protein